jgi:hypothetical protein
MLAGAVLPTSSADIFPNFTIKNYIAMTIFIASLSASSPDPYFDRSDQVVHNYAAFVKVLQSRVRRLGCRLSYPSAVNFKPGQGHATSTCHYH